MFLLLRIENGLLRKQNVITSQVEYYYFVDGVHHIFLAPAINPKEIIFFFPPPPSPPSVDGLYMTVFEDVATNVATFTGQQKIEGMSKCTKWRRTVSAMLQLVQGNALGNKR